MKQTYICPYFQQPKRGEWGNGKLNDTVQTNSYLADGPVDHKTARLDHLKRHNTMQ